MYNILMVDDMEINLMLLEAIITTNFKHNIYKAKTVKDALEIVENSDIDIILSDIEMPLLSGYDFLRELKSKEKTKNIPFVFISSVEKSDTSQIKAYEAGAIGFISKPINSKLLVSKLSSYFKIVDLCKEIKSTKTFVSLEKETRFSSMSEMIHMIAHQWRQPLATLSSININVKAKKTLGVLSSQNIDESIEKVENIIDYLNKTIDDFMDFLKDNEKKKNIFLGKLLSSPQKLLESYIDKSKCSIKIEYKDGLNEFSELFLLESKLNQVLLNMIKNSIDEFISKDILNPLIKVTCGVDDINLYIEVADNGGGIEKSMMDRIFQPYFSTKNKNATGIGLYMSKLIITKLFYGSISAKNIDEGASFKIAIPRDILKLNI